MKATDIAAFNQRRLFNSHKLNVVTPPSHCPARKATCLTLAVLDARQSRVLCHHLLVIQKVVRYLAAHPALSVLLLVAVLATHGVQAQAPPENPAAPQPAFDISVRTPSGFDNLRELVERHISLQRYREITDLDETELARLTVLAEQDVRNLAGTLGYFSPRIDITRIDITPPCRADP